MAIKFERSTCCDLNETITREWLVTNGLGGYAAGTVAGVLTRLQHGLLVAKSPDAVVPQLLVAKIDEEVTFDQRTYYLGTNEYRDGTLNPEGFVHLETFELADGLPIFTYRLGGLDGIVLEKRIWMVRGANTTCIQYRVLPAAMSAREDYRGGERSKTAKTYGAQRNLASRIQSTAASSELTLTLLPLATYRPYNKAHQISNSSHFQVHMLAGTENEAEESAWSPTLPHGVTGCSIQPGADNTPYHLLAVADPASRATFIPTGIWYWNFHHRRDAVTAAATDDLYLPGVIRATLQTQGHTTLTIVVSAEPLTPQLYQQESITLLYKEEQTPQQAQQSILKEAPNTHQASDQRQAQPQQSIQPTEIEHSADNTDSLDYLPYLLHAKEHFIKRSERSSDHEQASYSDLFSASVEQNITLNAEYYHHEARTRDALIALPGIFLVSTQYDKAYNFLRQLARHYIGGVLPDHIPADGHVPMGSDYHNVDNALWYIYALDQYLTATRHYDLLEEVFSQLSDGIQNYSQGTINNIHSDVRDGLLSAHKAGKALTWMNAYSSGEPVTARAGKAVEVNALWYHALILMHEWSERLGQDPRDYLERAEKCQRTFQQRFWNPARNCLYDVIDGPEGHDSNIRVNQLFALTLRPALLTEEQRQRTFEVITQQLLTPYGLRTQAQQEKNYHGQLGYDAQNDMIEPSALHQGSVWTWLIGPYIEALIAQGKETACRNKEQLYQEYVWHKGMRQLQAFKERFSTNLLGTCEGICNGDYPHTTGQQIASLLGTAELLRAYHLLAHLRTSHPEQVLSH